jgi:biopolymer transport protein ExbD
MGGGEQEEVKEPELVPLLDLVLQMVMFFMACTRFAVENVREDVKLPLAQSAKPVSELGTDIFYVNINERGDLLVNRTKVFRDGKIDGMVGKEVDDFGRVLRPGTFSKPRRNQEIRSYLNDIYEKKKAEADKRPDEPGKVRTLVILRAHQDCKFTDVYEAMRMCREAQFAKMQMRATIEK